MGKKIILTAVGAAMGALVAPLLGFFGAGRLSILIGAAAGALLFVLLVPRLGRSGT